MRFMNRVSGLVSVAAVALSVCAPTSALAQTVEYYHLDALGSVRAVTNQAGAVIERHDYLPFGEEVNPPGTSNTRKFTGKERDAETGLDYFGARYYSSRTARFTTIDPVYTWRENLADPQRWNRYAYARNNPLRYVDPDGRWIETLWDVTNVAVGVKSAYDNFRSGQYLSGVVDIGGALVDSVAAVVPVVPGGVGMAIKAARAAERADDMLDATKVVKEGIYEFPDALSAGRTYVGQSGNVAKRLGQHERSGKKAADAVATSTSVPGGKTAREVAEQRRINELGGIRTAPDSRTSNVRNPIGPARRADVDKK